ncbi:hypothetical protein VT06_09115 [Arsukibacterium sp. MJ3]|nr:hypothetical protein VT06_09115 [Arsukibacterium sp. MJ3]
MSAFCNNELSAKELGNIGDVSAVLNEEFSVEYEAFMADYAATGKSEHNADAVKEHLMTINADDEKINKVILRHKIQSECGANSLYSGNGLTKVNSKNRYGKNVPQQFGVAETFTFERDPLIVNELGSSVAILPAKPLRG